MNVINLFSSLSGLSSVHRFSMIKMTAPESVLEHTGWVTMVTCLLSMDLNSIKPGSILLNEALCRALIHDVDELVTGDVPRPTKYRNESTIAAFKEMSRVGVEKVVGSLDLRENVAATMIHHHTVAKDGTEGLVVDIADCMAVVYKAWEEVIVRRNCSMVKPASRLMDQLDDLSQKIEEEFTTPSQRSYLKSVINQCRCMVEMAMEMDDSVFGSNMRE